VSVLQLAGSMLLCWTVSAAGNGAGCCRPPNKPTCNALQVKCLLKVDRANSLPVLLLNLPLKESQLIAYNRHIAGPDAACWLCCDVEGRCCWLLAGMPQPASMQQCQRRHA
jgi:hypothetical protein